MAPFVDGLCQGKAIGRQCTACARTSFPPVRICACGSDAGQWTAFDGSARIAFRTDGSDGAFALVQFTGSDVQSVVRLVGFEDHQTDGQLVASATTPPQMHLQPIAEDAS